MSRAHDGGNGGGFVRRAVGSARGARGGQEGRQGRPGMIPFDLSARI